ncbi:lipase [Solihabitans fulvus]|uniref:Lipase n=1 Tax=Solihabitans fulvus TaxID=1892852 RepID=A0A5B2X055_9PSEU|nr:lipase family protein [Solihabitans fulvus]KAA2256718.1 lipase [Solihabitans fulvus]
MLSSLRRRAACLLVLASLAAAFGLAGPASAADLGFSVPTPSSDPFYTPPSPLPAGKAGDVLRSRQVDVYAEPLRIVPVPVRAWQVLYRSTSATGQPIAVSGTLLVPPTPWTTGARPLVSYAVGTHGLGDSCAPSYKLRTGTENEEALIAQALLKGWAVVITDYAGLGTPGGHTYAVGQAEGPAMLDAIRAAQQLPGTGLAAGGPAAVWGYSQGGQAAAFAGELQPTYAPDVHLVGIAAGGVPADLEKLARANDGAPWFGLVLGAAVGLSTAYQDVPFDGILNDAGRAAVAQVRTACVVELATAFAFHHLGDYLTVPDPLADPHWQARLAENHAGRHAPTAPVLVYHGINDEIIPLSVGEQLRADYCGLGATVDWTAFPLSEHITGDIVGAPFALSWLADRFAARPTAGSC